MIGSHIIPRFYLERFATPSERGKGKPGRIWVYEKGEEPTRRATSVQGFENGYFGYVCSDGSLEESFERVLADRESECNNVLVCAASDLFHWPHGSREKLALYAALLYSRATQRRDLSKKNHMDIIAELQAAANDAALIDELAQGLTQKLGKIAKNADVRDGICAWLEKAQHPATAKNVFLSDLLGNAHLIADVLLNKKPWRVLRPPPEAGFVTSDNPLITFVPLGNGKLHPGYGFIREEAVAAFPLAPNACLIMGNAWKVPKVLDITTWRELTEAFVSISDRYIYSKTRSDEIQETLQKYAGSLRYGLNAFMPIGIKLPTARQVLRAHFGLAPE